MDANQPGQQGERRRSPMPEREMLFNELRRAIGRAESLLQATCQRGDPSCADARERLEAILRAARMQLARYDDGKMDHSGTSASGEAKIFNCFNAGTDN
ncbi:hypothetical protein ACFQAT_06095 [Undibacterium arcticum]|uniref:Uncharacterized protein n=1 Tax=Undibacterium arcticum TaxID=1762892 RepID=A0ABV7EYJ1_9BURK